jgi:N-acyl-D-amino-acid deacylase
MCEEVAVDLLLEGARVVDGLGGPARVAHVGISGDRIAYVGPERREAAATVDLAGLVLAPGFVDIHAHTDYLPLLDPFGHSKVRDGVALEVTGNCGMSPFPLCDSEAADEARAHPGLDVDWREMGPYLERLRSRGMGLGRAFLVGHGTLRAAVMGYADRQPSTEELAEMQRRLDEALAAGAAGLSTGLIYAPGLYADVAEVAALCEVVARHDKLYASHIRGEGDTLLEAIDEVLEVARRSRARTQVSHLKASKPENWHKLPEAIVRIEAARAEGLDVMADRYPYTATSTGLHAVLPGWAHDGGRDALVDRCRPGSPDRERILEYLRGKHPPPYWDMVQVCGVGPAEDKSPEGRRVAAIAEDRGTPPYDTALDLIVESHDHVACVYHVLDEDNLRQVLALPWVMIGSDGCARATSGPGAVGRPHPRAFGTFARVLGHYVREAGLLTLEEAVRKMTAMPADRIGCRDRGRIREGAVADLVAFDPDTVADRATFEEPFAYSAGIPHLWIAGQRVLEGGEHTGVLAGGPVLPGAESPGAREVASRA